MSAQRHLGVSAMTASARSVWAAFDRVALPSLRASKSWRCLLNEEDSRFLQSGRAAVSPETSGVMRAVHVGTKRSFRKFKQLPYAAAELRLNPHSNQTGK
ncbi:hypothetical protein AAFF_G00105500 [Aldrovandia affinis]|uniref:Uncharacterized protein n=1 Tax=Aldrovandia affinis TaxID=143900 RepID=A0AAD7T2T5_9TELE|nr:hypothetical protein AAFF_G00105500 [Aldrovandia affinis]